MSKYIFETRMEVRDYECDIEGIVNNANYLHYTEHTRHRFLKHAGLSFARMHEKGVDAVVARMNLAFKTPLRCDDEFISRMGLRKEGVRYIQRRAAVLPCHCGTGLSYQRTTRKQCRLRPCVCSVHRTRDPKIARHGRPTGTVQHSCSIADRLL